MVFELHVLCPGFSLPSIDPQCLATISYLTQSVSRGEWILVENSILALDLESQFVSWLILQISPSSIFLFRQRFTVFPLASTCHADQILTAR